jgi:peroxiredoxin 2/4
MAKQLLILYQQINYVKLKTILTMKKTASILFYAMIFLSAGRLWAQYPSPFMERFTDKTSDGTIPLIGAEVPSFTANSTEGVINFPEDFGEDWKIIFSHPKDFTPVCSSELLELAHKQEDFNDLGARLIVISTDLLDQHHIWKTALEEIPYRGRDPVEIKFPMVDDNSFRVSNLLGMIHPDVSISKNIRGVYIIDPENKVRAINFYPNEVGRNINEIKRTLVALQKTHNNREIVTPANWQPGDDVMVPALSSDDMESLGDPDSPFYQISFFMTFRKME